MAIKDWVTIYPVGLDTVTQMPDLVLFVDKTRSSQMMAARNAIWTLETRVGSNALEAGSLYKRVADLEGSSGTDEKVKNTASDSTAGYLNDKIAAANGLAKATLNPGGNEQLQLSPSYGSTVNTVCQGNDSRLGDARTPVAHDLSGVLHNSTTLANLNLKISDANLDDASSPRTDPNAFHKTTAAEISALATEKVTPVAGDWLVGEDSAAGNAKIKIQVGNLPGGSGTDPNAFHKTTAAEISALATEKALPVAGDWLVGEDSAAGNAKVKIQVGSLPKGDTVPLSAAGDLLTRNASALVKLPAPVDSGLVLVSDITDSLKMRWSTVPVHAPVHEGTTAEGPWHYKQKFQAFDWAENRQFGLDAAVEGDVAILCSRMEAYVYNKIGGVWEFVYKFTGSFAVTRVALSLSVVAIGCGTSAVQTVWIYGKTGEEWLLKQTITAPVPGSGFAFGNTVSLLEDDLITTAYNVTGAYASQGALYYYQRSGSPPTFYLVQTILPNSPDRYFGRAISRDGTQMAVVAADTATTDGILYIYTKSAGSWSLEQRIVVPSSSTANSVSLNGNWCAIHGAGGGNKVRFYERTGGAGTWTYRSVLTPPGVGTFGSRIILKGDRLLISAWNDTNAPYNDPARITSAVYYYKKIDGVWIMRHKLTIPDPQSGLTNFGYSSVKDYDYFHNTAINSTFTELFVGAHGRDYAGRDDVGEFFYFTLYEDDMPSVQSPFDAHAFHDNVAGEINSLVLKASPVGTDEVVVEDSADLWNKKRVTLSSISGGGGTDPNAFHKTTAAEISALATEKVTPVAGDWLVGEDSAAGNAKVKIQIGNLPGGNGAELEKATTGLEPLGSTVSFDLTGATPSGQGLANTPSGYRIMVFRNGIKMTYAATPATYMDYYYDAGNNEIDVLAPGSADVYHIVFF